MRFPTQRRRGSPEGWQGENPKLRGAEATEIKTFVENETESARSVLYFIPQKIRKRFVDVNIKIIISH